jgi:hypothetical protein
MAGDGHACCALTASDFPTLPGQRNARTAAQAGRQADHACTHPRAQEHALARISEAELAEDTCCFLASPLLGHQGRQTPTPKRLVPTIIKTKFCMTIEQQSSIGTIPAISRLTGNTFLTDDLAEKWCTLSRYPECICQGEDKSCY